MKLLLVLIIFFSALAECFAQSGGILVSSLETKTTVDSVFVGNKIRYMDTLTNIGDEDLTLTSWSFIGADDSDFTVFGFNTPVVLKAHTSYLIQICCSPGGLGLRFATFTINTKSNNNLKTFPFPLAILGIENPNSVAEQPKNNGFSLGLNYPNPSSGIVTFNYSTPSKSEVNISLVSITGQIFKAVMNEKINEGEHSCTFDATGLPNGMYFITLKSKNTMLTRELTLEK